MSKIEHVLFKVHRQDAVNPMSYIEETPPMQNKNDLTNELEAIVDKCSLSEVVEMLAEVALAKSEHLSVNWQDKEASARWTRDGSKLVTLIAKLEN